MVQTDTMYSAMPDNEYLLLTPGPLTTTKRVKAAMLRDWCTWDRDYNGLVQDIRSRLVALGAGGAEGYTCVLMQGSGTFCVESVIGSVIPQGGKLAVLTNGAYGDRIAQMAQVLGIETAVLDSGELSPVSPAALEELLRQDEAVTHVAVVHSETTTGMLNPIAEVGAAAKKYGKTFIVDAMSSFGGIEMNMSELNIDYLISSANKCIQGVPGFGFVLARTEELKRCEGQARSLSLDLYDQWNTMERQSGKWRFTSPTHVVRAFHEALKELEDEGGIGARHLRYTENQRVLAEGMKAVGFRPLLDSSVQSPFITSFYYPDMPGFTFQAFYEELKKNGFVIYPGKISAAQTFRIGSIGDIHPADMRRLVGTIAGVIEDTFESASARN
ncbi:2-aminoethylphosphonate--pyruvate transaminase [Paenibacillus sp. UNC499MF]|uniref:2-aminoethylphosphonate--pyruvate transaminase n=1 Tax=Paenibacillus sp. UNC499MF TaxID=1502751 RepID=UPI00089FED66|nr:2-aminoethylphosphonate--pyruvate transaminase [Paenibacillus sp. UNC499MF]SEG53443.1 2-aminoethylphosphonate-pyruvate transaminase [Paenibacillus sp. UNC499MF]